MSGGRRLVAEKNLGFSTCGFAQLVERLLGSCV